MMILLMIVLLMLVDEPRFLASAASASSSSWSVRTSSSSSLAAASPVASSTCHDHEVESSSSSSSLLDDCFWTNNKPAQCCQATRRNHQQEVSSSSTSMSCSTSFHLSHEKRGHTTTMHQERPTLLESCVIAMMQLRGGGGREDGDDVHHHHPETTREEQALRNDDANFHGYTILKEEVIYNHWRKLIRRVVQFPLLHQQQQQQQQQHQSSRLVADFEIIAQGDHGGTVSDEAVLIFVWNRASKTATLIQEYMPASHCLARGLAAGMVEKKHASFPDCNANVENDISQPGNELQQQRRIAAEHELEEECRLHGGEWFVLCEPTILDKYTTTRLSAFLVIDPQPVAVHDHDGDNNVVKQRDATEQGMTVIPGVSISALLAMITSGQMTVVGSWGTLLALHKLRMLREIQQEDNEEMEDLT